MHKKLLRTSALLLTIAAHLELKPCSAMDEPPLEFSIQCAKNRIRYDYECNAGSHEQFVELSGTSGSISGNVPVFTPCTNRLCRIHTVKGLEDYEYAKQYLLRLEDKKKEVLNKAMNTPTNTNMNRQELLKGAMTILRQKGKERYSSEEINKGIEYLKQGVSARSAGCQLFLGQIHVLDYYSSNYSYSRYLKQDKKYGFELLLEVARGESDLIYDERQYLSFAQFYTGMCYYKGVGVEKNQENAEKWFLMSSLYKEMPSGLETELSQYLRELGYKYNNKKQEWTKVGCVIF